MKLAVKSGGSIGSYRTPYSLDGPCQERPTRNLTCAGGLCGDCTQRGVLVRGGRTLDKLVQAGTVALDKTGTLTTGIMSCVAMDAVELPGGAAAAGAACEYDALTLATALERLAVHPIARAVVAKGEKGNVPRVPVEQFEVRGRCVVLSHA